jgi:F-type H+-transporting ATPase subunit gamma
MPSLRDIRKRISSVKNTGKITRAMQMVSAAKFRKLQEGLFKARPYGRKIESLLANLSSGVERENYPLLNLRPRKSVELLVVTSDKGLCGAFNTNVLRAAYETYGELKRDGLQVSIVGIGRKARDYFTRRGIPMRHAYTDVGRTVSFEDTKKTADFMTEYYIEEKSDEVILIYNEFKSALIQRVKRTRLLPIEPPASPASVGAENAAAFSSKYIFEPSEERILESLLPKYIETVVYMSLLESRVSEEAARMMAMENANKNTKEMIGKLTLKYNKARQASITGELMDIVGGAAAISK